MRIIAGKHRSRILKTLAGINTRPMTDKMKESVFNTIGPYFAKTIILDLFGGSGALSLEAISRGAQKAYIIDNNREAIKVIEENSKLLKEEDNIVIIHASYQDALKRLNKLQFDLVFLDPPYIMNVNNEIIDILIKQNMLKKGAIIVCQYVKGNMTFPIGLSVLKNYTTGNTELSILQCN